MKTQTYPLAVPTDLLKAVRKTANETGLSLADTMRQSIKLGLPRLRDQLSTLKPFTAQEATRAFGPNPEFDALESVMAEQPVFPEE
jgi:hypothetical protein